MIVDDADRVPASGLSLRDGSLTLPVHVTDGVDKRRIFAAAAVVIRLDFMGRPQAMRIERLPGGDQMR